MIFNESKYNSKWDLRLLSDLGTFSRGKSKHRPRNDSRLFDGGNIPLIQTGEVREANFYIDSHKAVYNEFGLSQSKLWPQGTLCITIAANIAETALLRYPMCFPDSVVGFNADPDTSSERYMHYVFSYIRRAIQNATQGSIQDNINIGFLTSLKFRVPSKDIQDSIVGVLESIDEKIDLNNQINTELEQLAKLIYDYWFVQFDFPISAELAAKLGNKKLEGKPYRQSGGPMVYNEVLKREIPEGWDTGYLGSICSSIRNQVNPSTLNKSVPYVGLEHVPRKRFHLNNWDSSNLVTSNKNSFTTGDFLFGKLRPYFHKVVVTPLSGICSTDVLVLRECNSLHRAYVGSIIFSDAFVDFASQNWSGAQMPRAKWELMEKYSVPLPPENLLEKFNELILPLWQKGSQNVLETDELESLRDWLLPMLMNGQVTVDD